MSKMTEFRDFFLKEKPVEALVMLQESPRDSFCGEVSESIDSTYAHTVKIISRLEELDLIETRKTGRKKMIKLTPKGEEQAEILSSLLDCYGRDKNSQGSTSLGDTSVFSKESN